MTGKSEFRKEILEVAEAAISNSYQEYYKYGARCPKKLEGLHGKLAGYLASRIEHLGDFEVVSRGFGKDREHRLSYGGRKNHGKNCDITVLHKGRAIAVTEVKSPVSSPGKNTDNYVEILLGQASLIKRSEENPAFFHLMFTPLYSPRFSEGTIGKADKFGTNSVARYELVDKIDSIDGIGVCLLSPLYSEEMEGKPQKAYQDSARDGISIMSEDDVKSLDGEIMDDIAKEFILNNSVADVIESIVAICENLSIQETDEVKTEEAS